MANPRFRKMMVFYYQRLNYSIQSRTSSI